MLRRGRAVAAMAHFADAGGALRLYKYQRIMTMTASTDWHVSWQIT
jgi:hypothetical protein